MLKQINWLFPVLFYYLCESIIVAMVSWTLWHLFLINRFGFEFNFFEWITMIFCFKLIYNNLFAVMAVADKSNNSNIDNSEGLN